MNLATFFIGAVVLAVFLAILINGIRKRKSGCGGGCSGCASAGACHSKKQ